MTHPADLSLHEAGHALRSGALTSLSLTEAHLARIAFRNPAIGAFVHVATDAALAAARQADSDLAEGQDRGPMHGIPFAIKDIFDVQGWPVRWGSGLCRDRSAPATSVAVQRLIDAGAVPLGLVATYELATVGPDAGTLYPQPRNPWDRARITGGSSSGSAAAVAAGLVRIALGSDTGGSVRSPASYCGVVGLKPTYGSIPLAGVMPLSPALDHVGVIAATVAEAATTFAALARPVDLGPPGLAGLSVAFGRTWCLCPAAHPRLLPLMDAAAAALSLCGAAIVLTDLPDYPGVEARAADIILAEEFMTHGAALTASPGKVGPMATASILSGARVTKADMDAAQAAMRQFGDRIDALLSRHAVLILPTTMTPALPFSAFDGGTTVWTEMRTLPFNATGHPALSVPMGFADGLPMGLQIIGRRGDEATVLQVGAAFEAATDHGAQSPVFPAAQPA